MAGTVPEPGLDSDRREAILLGLAFAFVAVTAAGLSLSAGVRSGDWLDLGDRWHALVVLPVWAVIAWLTHRVACRQSPGRDPLLIPAALLLTGWGALAIWRIAPDFGSRQTAWMLVAGAALIEILRGPGDLLWLRRYRYLWLAGGISLTLLTLVFGTNPSGGEPRLWLGWGGVYFQPSEPMRLLLVAYLASYLADHAPFARRGNLRSLIPTLAPLLVMWGLAALLLVVQRDLGTGTLFILLLAVLLYVASNRWEVLLAAAGLVGIAGLLGLFLFDVVRLRLEAWLSPWGDPSGGSYQIVQSLISQASGGVFGRGMGLGAPGFVPVAHSDFIFSAIVEEWGLVGGLAVICLLLILVVRGFRLAAGMKDPFRVFLAAGITSALGLQSVLILGGVMRLLPLTGVTLPFVSYGGSSLLTSCIGVGILVRLPREGVREGPFRRPLAGLQVGAIALAFLLAAGLGLWAFVRSPELASRLDNPRRALAGLYMGRGTVLDRHGLALAISEGDAGSYVRAYPVPAVGAVIGYDSMLLGQAGLEAALDATLRGDSAHDPWTLWWSRLLTGYAPRGPDVRVTLDGELQTLAADLLAGRRGAAVVLRADSGDLLALASSPWFDPNRIEEEWDELAERTDAPLVDRALRGSYQPGMSMAPFVLSWAVRSGMADAASAVAGARTPVRIGARQITCLTEGTSPLVRLGSALQAGCPEPFAALGRRMGASSLEAMASAYGLDRPLGLVVGEGALDAAGTAVVVEDPSLAAIGQGQQVVSPVGLARAFAALAEDGRLPPLRLIEAIQQADGSWRALDPAVAAASAVDAGAATAAWEALARSGEGFSFHVGHAIVGQGEEQLVWFLGGERGLHGDPVVVVLLEAGSADDVRAIGMGLMRAAVASLDRSTDPGYNSGR